MKFLQRLQSFLNRPKLLDELFLIFASFFAALLVHTIWVNNFSSACLKVEYSNFRNEYFDYVFTSEAISTSLDNVQRDTGSALDQLYLYTRDYDYIVEYATSTTATKDFERSFALIPIKNDPFLESLYDNHRFQKCQYTGTERVTNTRFRDMIKDEQVDQIVTCPVVDQNRFLIGFLSAAYTRTNNAEELTGIRIDKKNGDVNYDNIEQTLMAYAEQITRIIAFNDSASKTK